MKDKLLEIYHYRRQQYLNREDSDLKILQGLLGDLSKVLESEEVKITGEKPWYPDDSGEWVEGELPKGIMSKGEVLFDSERDQEIYEESVVSLSNWVGDSDIVAYKVVKE